MAKHEYLALSEADPEKLGKLIESYEDRYELVTIVFAGSRFVAWVRRPRGTT
jgi:hypothetical protein